MSITKDVNNVIQYTLRKDTWESDFTGVLPSAGFRIAGDSDVTQQMGLDPNAQAPNTTVLIKGNAGTSSDITITLPSTSGTLSYGGTTDSFSTIQTPLGTSPVATSAFDTLTLASDGSIDITGNAGTDTVTLVVNTSALSSTFVLKSGDTMTGQLVAPSFQALDSGETLTASHDSGNDTMLVESSKDLTLKAVNDLYVDAAAIRTGGELYSKGSHIFSPDDSKSFDTTYDSGGEFFKLDSASPVVYNAGEFQINGVNGVLLQTGSGSAMAIGDAVIVNSQGGDGIELNGLASDAQIKMKGGEPLYFRSPSDSGFNHYSRDGWLVWFGELESSSYIIHNEAPSVKEDVFILDVNGEVRLSSFNDKGTYLNSPKGVAVNLSSDPTAHVDVAESDSSKASLRIRSGSAPSAPNDGDIWFDGSDLKIQIGGVTKTFTVT